MRARHLTCTMHLEKSPLPPQLQLMQIHLNTSIFATQHFKKIAGGNQTCCFLRRSGNIHSQALSNIIHYTFLSILLTACISPTCLRRTDTLVLYPAEKNCIYQRGTSTSMGLLSRNVDMPALFQGQFSWQGKILTVDCTLAAANIGSSSINSHSH